MSSTGLSFGAGLEFVKPDAVFGPESTIQAGPLRPCPHCGANDVDAPEGIHDVHTVKSHPGTVPGDPKWGFPHCWQCGFRPGTNVAVSQQQYAAAFSKFKDWYDGELAKLREERGMSPGPESPLGA